MRYLPVNPSYGPKFKVGQRVWYIMYRTVREALVRSIQLEHVCIESKRSMLTCTGYSLFNSKEGGVPFEPLTMSEFFRPSQVYASRQQATSLARWHAVEGITDEQYKAALGSREKGEDDSLDTCELQRCCASISQLRDYLFKCQEGGGLIHRDWRDLRYLLPQHEYPLPADGGRPKNLDLILNKLGLLKFVNDKRE